MEKRVIECLNCYVKSQKEIHVEDRGLVGYKCLDCGANVFDKIEEEDHD
jgi:hypothetical protein